MSDFFTALSRLRKADFEWMLELLWNYSLYFAGLGGCPRINVYSLLTAA
jgi:hypothetical protein